MILVCLAIGGIFFVGDGDLVPMLVLAGVGGFAGGGADVVFPSLQADVIDYDEYRTGQRKEGMYFAAWNFVAKTALGLTGVLTGVALTASGFQPNQEQSETAKLAIRSLMSGWPLLCYGAGAFLFLRFALTRQAHAKIRAALDARI
jgi:GPH family glycoside/pentoside/hexuronide:cation symporter